MQSEATDPSPIHQGQRTNGGGESENSRRRIEIRSALTIGADGRHSIVREQAGLQVMDLGAPMDVFWMRISRHVSDPAQTLGTSNPAKCLS